MISSILIKAVKDIACGECGLVTGRVASFCNIDFTEVDEFGTGISVRMLGAFMGAEEGRNSNMMTNEMSKALNKSIYT